MGDHSRSHHQDLLHILGFGSIYKTFKAFISKCYPEEHSLFSKKSESKSNLKPIEEDSKINRFKSQKSKKKYRQKDNKTHHARKGSFDANIPARTPQWSPPVSTSTCPSALPRDTSLRCSSFFRSTSKKSQTLEQPAKASLLKATSQRNGSASAAFQRALSRSTSRIGSTPIIFSNSNGIMKPAAMEQQLECTLEELCFGCIKKVKIKRDAVTEYGEIVEEDEVLTIKVKPGWRKGTKITFEGKGNEMPGTDPADVIYVATEKEHTLFRRNEDDLELDVEILLVDALTGCTLLVPLLGGQTQSLTIDDIVHPGYQKIIQGQGMPQKKDPAARGNLIITISIKFPEELTTEQRSIAANILEQAC